MTTAPTFPKTVDTFLPAEKQFFVAHWADCLKAATAKSDDKLKSEARADRR